MVFRMWLVKFKKICNRFYARYRAHQQEHYFDCWSIIVEESRLLPISYYYLYSQDEIAKMEAEVWQELEEKIKGL